jgi:16S rRNA (guanine527-N7)-methyltransferase
MRQSALSPLMFHVKHLNALETYVQMLRKWQPKLNLVATGPWIQLWTRHFLDSFQLFDAAPEGSKTSGLIWVRAAGFPAWSAPSALDYDLESTILSWWKAIRGNALSSGKLRGKLASSSSRNTRIEAFPRRRDHRQRPRPGPLPRCSSGFIATWHLSGSCLLQKGANHSLELETARADWQMDVDVLPSVTAADSVILRIRNLSHA